MANLWLRASDQQAIADAANRLDRALAIDPDAKGQSVGKFFVREETLLAVLYHVNEGDRMVRVIAVKRTA